MAATDQTYRNQKYLDVIFGVSCVLMLVGTVWMFAQDYFREFKRVQREFRDVEEAMAQRTLVSLAPTPYDMQAIEAAQKDVAEKRQVRDQIKAEQSGPYNELLVAQVKAEGKQRSIKAEYDSIVSFFNIAIDKRNAADPTSAEWKALNEEVKRYQERINVLKTELDQAQAEVSEIRARMDKLQKDLNNAEVALTSAENELKRLTADFDRFHKLAAEKRWGFGDWLRSQPVLDAFASPLRIQQYTLESLPINYSFKYVTRYDRCTTCHLGMERENYTPGELRALGQEPNQEMQQKLANAKSILDARRQISKDTPGLSSSDVNLNPVKLTDSQVRMFAAHPRLDLFVSPGSPHNAERFGCTICHSGQGSSTDFFNASHSPNTSPQEHHWQHEYGWQSNHYWDYTMLPKRFTESSCIKCHHQVTDLIRDGSRIEAPKVFEGYMLVKEMGCFGCHEISGRKGGKAVGPDLRLEPDPPLEELPAAERARILADTANPPGTMRKVGPNLRRLAEKTNEEWTRRWLMAPRDFRPTTKMPHFYGVTNNNAEALKGTGQENFPSAEIYSVTHLLFERSRNYLRAVEDRHQDPPEVVQREQQRHQQLVGQNTLSDAEKRELAQLEQRINRRKSARPVAHLQLPADQGGDDQLRRGRQLFSERGCLACHHHDATDQPGNGLPAIVSPNDFGPDLTRIADKLGVQPGDSASARRWLVQWIMDPTVHHPRSFMPVTHLTLEQANDVAAWLLSQKSDWKGPTIAEPSLHDLKKLAREHLQKAVPLKRELDEMLPLKEDKMAVLKGFSKEQLAAMKPEADEQELSEPLTADKLKMYIGRKAINTLGCYGCHYIPGYRDAKPIGTPLNDWGVKRADRLAFEDAAAYVAKKYHIVPERTLAQDLPKDEQGNHEPWTVKDGKLPYEQFFFDLLEHHHREGFLHQKLLEPRSYDYSRIRNWEERLRMPQFRFSRKMPGPNATPAEIAASEKAEAEAREAVMTFILGLVAEDIPKTYIYNPPPDKLAEIKGRQTLDKFNCSGCHMVRPAVYDLKINPKLTWLSEEQIQAKPEALQVQNLEAAYLNNLRNNPGDHLFPQHIAWDGHDSKQLGRLTAFGTNPTIFEDNEGQKRQLMTLTHALQFPMQKWQDGREQLIQRDIPAAVNVQVLPEALIRQPDGSPYAQAYGGYFANHVVPYLQKVNPTLYPADRTGETNARAAAPPSLVLEGEKTQPAWLFRFLKNPHEIRPVTVLRMPRFNMGDDDIRSLVDYFSAVDKVSNPGVGLEYPYMPIPQREESYLLDKNAQYINRLKEAKVYDQRLQELRPVWERLARTQLAEFEQRQKNAEKAVQEAKDEATRKLAEKARDDLKKEFDALQSAVDKNDFPAFKARWERKDAYLVDAYRLTASSGSNSICLGCHQVGSLRPSQQLGPPLQLTWERLRPEWTERWLANPGRFWYHGTPPMPQNFASDKNEYGHLFLGLPPERIAAVQKKLEPLAGPYQKAKATYDQADQALFEARQAIQQKPADSANQKALADAEKAFAAARASYDKARAAYEPAAQEARDLVRLFSRNQLTAVRDGLIDYLKMIDVPENRGGPVPAQSADKK